MKISISAVSGNRKFTKALVRYSEALNDLRTAASDIDSESLPYDTFQIVFLDRDQEYLHSVGCKKDRLFQVEVSTPSDSTDYTSRVSVVKAVGEKLNRALQVSGLPHNLLQQLEFKINSVIEE